jgi:hypothetical protein
MATTKKHGQLLLVTFQMVIDLEMLWQQQKLLLVTFQTVIDLVLLVTFQMVIDLEM